MFARLPELFAKLFTERASAVPDLLVTADGFDLLSGDQIVDRLIWRDVREILAYRYNGSRIDMMALMFHVPGDPGLLGINEESQGWENVIGAMRLAFPTISANWHFDVRPTSLPIGLPEYKSLFKRS